MGVLGKLVQMGTDINDRVIYNYLLENAKKNAKAYLTAALVCTSPDLRAFFASQLTQSINFHARLVALGTAKGWHQPEIPPYQVLLKELKNTEALLNHELTDEYPEGEK